MLNELAERIHQTAVEHGWYDEERRPAEMLMLCVSELSEALEELRAGHRIHEVYAVEGKPEGFPIEIADCLIRILDMSAALGIDMDFAVNTKTAYNETRPYRHGGKTL